LSVFDFRIRYTPQVIILAPTIHYAETTSPNPTTPTTAEIIKFAEKFSTVAFPDPSSCKLITKNRIITALLANTSANVTTYARRVS
jgi:hypothetical protein